MAAKHDAIKSLYGKGHAHATRARECVAMPGKRQQTICTPANIINRVLQVWPEGIALDPCPETWRQPDADSLPTNVPASAHVLAGSGLDVAWPERTYCNPPYGNLRPWLEKAAASNEVMVLAPVRTHRKWFHLDRFDAVCFLYPLTFRGYKQAFPAPLVLLYNGRRSALFTDSFCDIGRVSSVMVSWDNLKRDSEAA